MSNLLAKQRKHISSSKTYIQFQVGALTNQSNVLWCLRPIQNPKNFQKLPSFQVHPSSSKLHDQHHCGPNSQKDLHRWRFQVQSWSMTVHAVSHVVSPCSPRWTFQRQVLRDLGRTGTERPSSGTGSSFWWTSWDDLGPFSSIEVTLAGRVHLGVCPFILLTKFTMQHVYVSVRIFLSIPMPLYPTSRV